MNYGYCRVSTKQQAKDGNSIEEQKEKILKEYSDAIIEVESKSGCVEREIFNALIEKLQENDKLIITKLDRFCRTTKEGLQFVDRLMVKGVKVHILNLGLIEDTPMGRLIVTNLLAFAEFERAMILERTQSGKMIARQKEGYKEGRPKEYNIEKISKAVLLLNTNGGKNSYSEVVKITGISKSTLIREVRKIKNEVNKNNEKHVDF